MKLWHLHSNTGSNCLENTIYPLETRDERLTAMNDNISFMHFITIFLRVSKSSVHYLQRINNSILSISANGTIKKGGEICRITGTNSIMSFGVPNTTRLQIIIQSNFFDFSLFGRLAFRIMPTEIQDIESSVSPIPSCEDISPSPKSSNYL